MTTMAQKLKDGVSPERYYGTHLVGTIGKPTGDGWHLWNGLCPFHSDTRPGSFVINTGSGAFRCFSCGARGGDIIAFHMERYTIGFREALGQLGSDHHG